MLVLIVFVLFVIIALTWHAYPDSHYHKKYGCHRNERKAPSLYRYESYQNPSEEQHRTAEQFNWKSQNRLTLIAVALTAIAAFFAVMTYWQTRRQADAAVATYFNIEKPIIYFMVDGTGVDTVVTIANVGDKPAMANDTLVSSHYGENFEDDGNCLKHTGARIFMPKQVITEKCTNMIVDKTKQQFTAGSIEFQSLTNGGKWRKKFEYFYSASANGWATTDDKEENSDRRIDDQGNEIADQPPS